LEGRDAGSGAKSIHGLESSEQAWSLLNKNRSAVFKSKFIVSDCVDLQ